MNEINRRSGYLATPEMADGLKRAIELGKFPDGRIVSGHQRELMLEATIIYDSLKLPEQERTGFIHRKKTASGILDSSPDGIPLKDMKHY